jgi:hypothetical protein
MVTVSWLVRGEDNGTPDDFFSQSVTAGETLVLEDVIFNDFGFEEGNGAFLIEVDGGEVIANSRIFATEGDATFGQGFEGVPSWAATQAGQTTNVVGLSFTSAFRTNIYATAGAGGASIDFSLLDPDGVEFATASLSLDSYEPYLRRVNQLFQGVANFDNATLHAEVTDGSAVIGASKVDNASTDPTTLESAATGGGGGVNGIYQFALYDTLAFASGGNVVVSDGEVMAINGTFTNWDKLDGADPACPLIFQFGQGLSPAPLEDFADGVSFADSYASTGGGVLTFTVIFEPGDGSTLEGTVTAVGSEFTGIDEGCNGEFPPLTFMAGFAP